MKRLTKWTYRDARLVDDGLHLALDSVEDFQWGEFWLRCIEFRFLKPEYRVRDAFGWHVHHEIQLEIPLSGEFQFTIKGERPAAVRPGHVFVIPMETPHRWKCARPGVMLGILLANIRRGGKGAGGAFAQDFPSGIAPGVLDDDLRRAFLSNVRKPGIDTRRLALWIRLLIDTVLADCLPDPELLAAPSDQPRVTRTQRIVSKMVRFIDANIGGDLSIDRLEAMSNLSSRQIQRLFSDAVGVSCHHYIMNRRLEVAREKLSRDPAASIKEVAYACGFSSPAHFTTNFKQAYGVPPSEFSP